MSRSGLLNASIVLGSFDGEALKNRLVGHLLVILPVRGDVNHLARHDVVSLRQRISLDQHSTRLGDGCELAPRPVQLLQAAFADNRLVVAAELVPHAVLINLGEVNYRDAFDGLPLYDIPRQLVLKHLRPV